MPFADGTNGAGPDRFGAAAAVSAAVNEPSGTICEPDGALAVASGATDNGSILVAEPAAGGGALSGSAVAAAAVVVEGGGAFSGSTAGVSIGVGEAAAVSSGLLSSHGNSTPSVPMLAHPDSEMAADSISALRDNVNSGMIDKRLGMFPGLG